MKKYIKNLVIYILCLVTCVGLLAGCKRHYHCKPKKMPANIKPIDCNNFNDVTTVYWYLHEGYDEHFGKPSCGTTLLVKGWGYKRSDYIILCDSVLAEGRPIGVVLHWRGTGNENDIDYYYISCSLFGLHYFGECKEDFFVELIGERIYPQIENE